MSENHVIDRASIGGGGQDGLRARLNLDQPQNISLDFSRFQTIDQPDQLGPVIDRLTEIGKASPMSQDAPHRVITGFIAHENPQDDPDQSGFQFRIAAGMRDDVLRHTGLLYTDAHLSNTQGETVLRFGGGKDTQERTVTTRRFTNGTGENRFAVFDTRIPGVFILTNTRNDMLVVSGAKDDVLNHTYIPEKKSDNSSHDQPEPTHHDKTLLEQAREKIAQAMAPQSGHEPGSEQAHRAQRIADAARRIKNLLRSTS